jgi:hypothetical protein
MNPISRRNLVLAFAGTAATTALAPMAFAQPRDGGEFRILQARYGTAERNVDVTQRLQELARADQQFRIKNSTFGVDPDEGRVKTLRIFARAPNGQTQTFEYREGDTLDGSRFAGWSGGRWGESHYRGGWDGDGPRGNRGDRGRRDDDGQYRIQQALYGTSRRNVDVTERLREIARSDRSFRLTNDLFGVDPAEGRVKTLRIYARGPGGTNKTFEYREGSTIDGSQFAGWGRGDWGQNGRRGGWGR